jgi:hypothetical protein
MVPVLLGVPGRDQDHLVAAVGRQAAQAAGPAQRNAAVTQPWGGEANLDALRCQGKEAAEAVIAGCRAG